MKLSSIFFPPRCKARHCKRTFVASPDDEASQPTRAVIECALASVRSTLDGDLADPETFRHHAALLSKADLIFVDGPKDRRFEPAFAANLDTLAFDKAPWVVFDDIRDLNMLRFWRELNKPKIDLSSFGHWTGTGLVHWSTPGTEG